MKKLAIAILFALTAVPQVFAYSEYSVFSVEGSENSSGKSYSSQSKSLNLANSFFWRLTTGINIENGEIYREGDDRGEQEWADFSALGDAWSLQFGINFKRFFALYFGTDFVLGTGSYCPELGSCRDASHYKFNFNLGTLFYPFRSTSVMKGVNFGASLGFEGEFFDVESLEYSDETDMLVDNPGIALKTEIGYTWDVSRRISLGIEFNFTLNLLFDIFEYDDVFGEDTYKEASAYSIGILFNLMRR
ncbi:MAG: hypothetical protein HUK19_02540 [Fibrobacter sp.]|nr:hypothetical protein [Fibrobacter sp.]